MNLLNGNTDAKMFGIGPDAAKLNLLSKLDQTARNFTFYADSFDLAPGFALVAGTNYLHAVREQGWCSPSSRPGRRPDVRPMDPKLALLRDVDPGWQVFANLNKSAEILSFGENQIGNPILTGQAQEAVTYEIGTRGRRTDYSWDLAVYRANIDHELQCLNANLGSFCQVVNANETVHQGIEAGFGAAVWKSIVVTGRNPDKLWLNTAYTFSDFRFDHDPGFGDNQIPARRGTTCAPSTSTRRASISAPTSSGCRRPTTSTTPTPSKARGTRSGAPRPASTTAAAGSLRRRPQPIRQGLRRLHEYRR